MPAGYAPPAAVDGIQARLPICWSEPNGFDQPSTISWRDPTSSQWAAERNPTAVPITLVPM
jgi:hypothetical protein